MGVRESRPLDSLVRHDTDGVDALGGRLTGAAAMAHGVRCCPVVAAADIMHPYNAARHRRLVLVYTHEYGCRCPNALSVP
jgi:hypothetical protein